MTHSRCPVLLTAILIAAPIVGSAQNPEPSERWLELLGAFSAAGIVRHADIPYDAIAGVDPERLSLDVYTHPDLERAPVLLFIHGGGWQRGSKRAVGQKPLRFVAEGFVVVASNYRFRPQVEVPEMARDVAAAVAWIKGKIDEYGGNPSRIFLMGHSAGAHLTALVGTNGAYLESVGLSLADLGGVIPLDTGPYNVELQMKRVPPTSRYGRLMRSVFGEDAERWSPVSPWHHVKANAGTPPFLVFYHEGRMDAPVQAIPFVERLVAAGVEAEAVEAVGRTHGGLNRELGAQGDEPTDVVLAFLTAHGQLTGESQIARSITQTRSRMTMLGSIIRSVGIRP